MLPYLPDLEETKAILNMPIDWSQYSLHELRAHSVHTFRQGGGSRPDVLLIDIDGQRAVLKDHGSTDKPFATLLGPILNWRECKALSKLDTLECVPNLLHAPDRRSFLMTYHKSEQITRLENIQPNWPDFFEELSLAINRMHQAGVSHNDLRNASNILITSDGKPILVDLVGCFCQGSSWNLPKQWVFDKFRQVDLSAITKLKTQVAPELITEQDVVREEIAGNAGMVAKGVGQWVRKASRLFFTK